MVIDTMDMLRGSAMKTVRAVVIVLLVAGVPQGWAADPLGRYAEESRVVPVDEAFRTQLTAGKNGRLLLHWQMPPGFYLYRDKLRVGAGGELQVTGVHLPPGEREQDDYLGEVEIWRDTVTVAIDRSQLGGGTLRVTFQGCQAGRVCYPPTTRSLQVPSGLCTQGHVIAAGMC